LRAFIITERDIRTDRFQVYATEEKGNIVGLFNNFSFKFTHLTNPTTTVLQERSGFVTVQMKMDGSS